MDITEIVFELNKHCIETGAKKTYEKMLNACFSKSASKNDITDSEQRVHAIKFFLEHTDFGYLRCTYPELNGTYNTKVILRIPENLYDMKLECSGKSIELEWKTL